MVSFAPPTVCRGIRFSPPMVWYTGFPPGMVCRTRRFAPSTGWCRSRFSPLRVWWSSILASDGVVRRDPQSTRWLGGERTERVSRTEAIHLLDWRSCSSHKRVASAPRRCVAVPVNSRGSRDERVASAAVFAVMLLGSAVSGHAQRATPISSARAGRISGAHAAKLWGGGYRVSPAQLSGRRWREHACTIRSRTRDGKVRTRSWRPGAWRVVRNLSTATPGHRGAPRCMTRSATSRSMTKGAARGIISSWRPESGRRQNPSHRVRLRASIRKPAFDSERRSARSNGSTAPRRPRSSPAIPDSLPSVTA